MADYFYVKSENLLSNGNYMVALQASDKALRYNPNEPAYYKQRARTYIVATLEVEEEDQKTLKQAALSDLTTALELNPTNLATIRNTAPLYFFLANNDLAKPATKDNIDYEYLPVAQEYLMQMQNYVPEDVGVQILAAKYQKRLLLNEDYRNSRERIQMLRPDLLEWHPDLTN